MKKGGRETQSHGDSMAAQARLTRMDRSRQPQQQLLGDNDPVDRRYAKGDLVKNGKISDWISLYDAAVNPPLNDLKEPLSPEEDIVIEDDALKSGKRLDTTEFVSLENDRDSTMYNRGTKTFTKGYVPKITTLNIFDIPWADTFISSIKELTKMQGLIRGTIIHFKTPPQEDPLYITKNSKLIATLVAYQTGIMMLKRLEQMSRLRIPTNGTYFKITLSLKNVYRKPKDQAPLLNYTGDQVDDGTYVYNTFTQEEELHRYQQNGVPWGIASPTLAYKTSFNATQRATFKAPYSSYGWSHVRTLSANINMYEVHGTRARGHGKHRHYRREGDPEFGESDDEEERAIDYEFMLENATKKIRGTPGNLSSTETNEKGILYSIAHANAIINPNCTDHCFFYALKLGLIYALRNEEYVRKLKNMQLVSRINKEYSLLKSEGLFEGFIKPENFPINVPLDETYFSWFCEMNQRIFLHVWIQIESKNVPVLLFYRCAPLPNKIPVHILYIGPTVGEKPGHYVCIKNINRLFYRTEKCFKKTKFYCPYCTTYTTAHPCTKHEAISIENALFCPKCMTFFETPSELRFHEGKCLITDSNLRTIVLPDKDERVSFKENHYLHTYKIPVVFVADFESVLAKLNPETGEFEENPVEIHSPVNCKKKIFKIDQHIPCSFGVNVIVQEGVPQIPYFSYTGTDPDDVMDHFCYHILSMSEFYFNYYKDRDALKFEMTELEKEEFDKAMQCHVCKRYKSECHADRFYPDFDKYSEKFLGAACKMCLTQKKGEDFFIPLVFHNARGYDLHHILNHITKEKFNCRCNGIPQNGQKLMSLTISRGTEVREVYASNGLSKTKIVKDMCDIRIIDSLLFLLKSLERLVDIHKRSHPDNFEEAFPITYKTFMAPDKDRVPGVCYAENFGGNGHLLFKFTKEQVDMIMQKNLYPYKWFDSFKKFDAPWEDFKKIFSNALYAEFFGDNIDIIRLTEKQAQFWEVIHKIPEINSVRHYTNVYLACDVLQLSDIIESTRDLSMKTHKLDPMYYFGAPGYSWDAYLYKLTSETPYFRPKLFGAGEMNMICFFMQGIRGGCSGIMKRYAVANNKHMGDLYDPTKESSYIIYLDANNLYGWSMQQDLPFDEFQWIDDVQLKWLNALDETFPKVKIRRFIEDLMMEGKSAFLEVKLEYPTSLHEDDNLYPMAPERSTVQLDDISRFTSSLNVLTSYKMNNKTPMLLQTLRTKDHYFVHAKNLILYMDHGLEFVKIYSGITFKQMPIMKEYIDLNTKLRNAGKTEREKELYKLYNNAIYGKTFENPMKYSRLKLVNGVEEYNKVVAMTGFKGSVFEQDDFMIAKILYEQIKYDKPLYLGATITEYAKYLMFNFYYNVLKSYYNDYYHHGKRVQLLFTDTDSLMLQIFTDDIFKDIAEINATPEYHCPFDVSSFDPKVVEEYNIPHQCDKEIGKFKSETGSKIIYRFIGLRSKMYAYQTVDEYLASSEACHKRGKGIPSTALMSINMKAYLECLFGTSDEEKIKKISDGQLIPKHEDPKKVRQEFDSKGIRSFNHKIFSIMARKYGLSCNDTKRFILEDNIHTLAYGHWKILDLVKDDIENCDTDSEEELDIVDELEKKIEEMEKSI